VLDVVTLEWLIVFAGLAVLGFVAAWVTRRTLREIRGMPHQPNTEREPEPWHALSVAQVLETIDSSRDGLSTPKAKQRIAEHGPTRLPEAKPRGPLIRFLAQFHNVLIYVLLAAGAVTALLHHWLDAGVILGVVVVNALIGFVQEGKAEDALRAIRRMLSPRAMVLRDGHRITVDAVELVPGDVGVDPTLVSPAAISITARPVSRSYRGRTAHTD